MSSLFNKNNSNSSSELINLLGYEVLSLGLKLAFLIKTCILNKSSYKKSYTSYLQHLQAPSSKLES